MEKIAKSLGGGKSLIILSAVIAVAYFPAFNRHSSAADHKHENKVSNEQDIPAGTLPGGPFTLVDHKGRTVTDKDFRGSFLLVSFGYTHCPDVCPLTLAQVSATLKRLGKDARYVRPLFITVDSERDTPEVLASYVKAFHPAIIGLTGTPQQIRSVTKAYNAYYAKVPLKTAGKVSYPSHYKVDHTSFIYLMGSNGSFVDVFGFKTSPQKMADKIREELKKERS
ncbi:MAG: SCO family protein [Deltaproteobacteria bacterium]|nr:SCO family protein [Deltaproteobacteria bacterium]